MSAPPDEESDASELDFLFEGDEADEDAPDGIELDDFQADEVHRIFMTTLPEYLGPVEEMVTQLLSEEGGSELVDTLSATLASISQAATRIGVSDVAATLDAMRDRLPDLVDEAAAPEARKGVLAGLTQLKAMVGQEEGVADAPSQTIFKALRGMAGIDDAVLERLTTAGLLTVDQLMSARPDEIVAVSGLDAETVDRIRGALLQGHEPAAAPRPKKKAPAPIEEPSLEEVAVEEIAPSDLREELRRRLGRQVDAEAALDETRAELLRLRVRAEDARRELADAAKSRHELRRAITRQVDRLAERMSALEQARQKIERLRHRGAEAERLADEVEARVHALRDERAEVVAEHERLRAELAELSGRIEALVRTTLRR